MLQNINFKDELLKIGSFLYVVFIMADILIIIRSLLKNYGDKLEWSNIVKTLAIFISITIFLFILRRKLIQMKDK